MATLQQLSDQARARVDDLLDRIVPALVALEPAGFYGQEAIDDLRQAADAGVRGVLGVLAGESLEQACSIPRTAGRRQVQQDLPLEGVLRAYRVAGQVLWEDLVEHGGAASAQALLAGASDVWRVVDSLSAAAAEEYRAEESRLRRRDERVRSALLAALLDGMGADPQFARDAERALGLAAPWALVVALAEEPGGVALDSPHDRLEMAGSASVWVSTATGEVGLVATGALSRLQRTLQPALRGRAGICAVHGGPAGLPTAHRRADVAARTAAAGRIAQLEDDLVRALTFDSPLVADVVHERTVRTLERAAGEDAPALLATVRAFLAAGGSLNVAAVNGHLHRNTVLYRIKKVERLTGVPLRELAGQVLWVLGLNVSAPGQDAPRR